MPLFFFPRPSTSYCQMQALLPEFAWLGVQVAGVSSDIAQQQTVFRDSCRLDFPLITDSGYGVGELGVDELYGVMEATTVDDEPTWTTSSRCAPAASRF